MGRHKKVLFFEIASLYPAVPLLRAHVRPGLARVMETDWASEAGET